MCRFEAIDCYNFQTPVDTDYERLVPSGLHKKQDVIWKLKGPFLGPCHAFIADLPKRYNSTGGRALGTGKCIGYLAAGKVAMRSQWFGQQRSVACGLYIWRTTFSQENDGNT